MGLGWAWAALAVGVGWLAGTSARGALAGALALLVATAAYYGLDSVLRQESLAVYWSEMLLWWSASVVFGAILGVVGAGIRRLGAVGLLAGLAVPVGAAAQMFMLPDSVLVSPAEFWGTVIVWVGVAVGVGVVLARFVAARPGRRGLSARHEEAGDDRLEQHPG